MLLITFSSENTQDFGVLDRSILDALRAMPEYDRVMKGLYNWVGFTLLGWKPTPTPAVQGGAASTSSACSISA